MIDDDDVCSAGEVDGVGGCSDKDDGDDESHYHYLLRACHISVMGTSTDSAVGTGAPKMSQPRPSKTTLCSGTCKKWGWGVARGSPGWNT